MKKIRCAIYTRKSAEEGLEQEFNSLDAQREACAAYVASPSCPKTQTNSRLARREGMSPAAVEFGRVAAAPVNTLRQQTHRCQEISVCF